MTIRLDRRNTNMRQDVVVMPGASGLVVNCIFGHQCNLHLHHLFPADETAAY